MEKKYENLVDQGQSIQKVRTGLRQCDTLTATLLEATLKKSLRTIPALKEIKLFENKMLLAYADSIMVSR